MKKIIDDYKKHKEYLVCVDSDGCVMDTMNRKHSTCFGPMLLEEWEFFGYETFVLETWNTINLYSKTRGINRFKGLIAILDAIEQKGIFIDDLQSLRQWATTTRTLSNHALEEEIKQHPSPCLKKALSWSNRVNQAIKLLPEEICMFPHAYDVLTRISSFADIVVVSSANKEAMEKEWKQSGCAKHVRALCGQEDGTKSLCIQGLLQVGYEPKKTLMVGDAIGDLEAAIENGVNFYPILVGNEANSWLKLEETLKDMMLNKFTDASQEQLLYEMKAILT